MTPEMRYRRIQYQIANAREERGIKIKDMLKEIGVGENSWRTVAYGRHGANILTVIKVADGLGYELVLRRKE